jgi:hypothetical protein
MPQLTHTSPRRCLIKHRDNFSFHTSSIIHISWSADPISTWTISQRAVERVMNTELETICKEAIVV